MDLSPVFNKAIERIRAEVIKNILHGQQLNGKPYTPNKEATEKQKGFNKRLVGKNKTFITPGNYKVKKATKASQSASLEVPSADIMMYNQQPTGKGTIAKEDAAVAWGISEDMANKSNDDIARVINKYVDDEMRKMGFTKL